ncbi:putative Ig domain-containing protein [Streptomyces mayteni]
MTHVWKHRPSHLLALLAALLAALGVVVPPPQAGAADREALLTGNVVEVHETVSDAGFTHPGVGLSAEDLRTAQTQVRAGQEPWASYFAAMADTTFASTTYRASNSKSAAEPDVPLDPTFTQVGQRRRETNDSFGALTQSLMWVVTGDETYRRNAVQALRAWAGMDPESYAYFPDAHIHTGHPLYQFLMAAEIIRATEPLADDTPGTSDGYDVVWSAEDDRRLLDNFANPVVETFLFSNRKWMNQHNFGLFGRIATAIYADDADGYARGVEWFTVNSTYDGYDNGALAPQIPVIAADDPANPYGREFTQVREMGRDQAHGECNIDNFTGLARMLEVQGTRVDPAAGTVSTANDAVSAYDFLDRRLLQGADAFYGFMMGARTPWVDERGEGWNGTISEAYRGRLFNPVNELYYEYAYERGVDVEDEAPWLAELSARMDGPYFHDGVNRANFWAPGDKNPEYWVAFPAELAGTEPVPLPDDPDLPFDGRALRLDDRTEIVTEDDETFARAHVDERGTVSVVSRLMHDGRGGNAVLVRTEGPALLEVLDKEPVSGLNGNELAPTVLATVRLPDTGGAWRYVTYPEGGSYVAFYRLTGRSGTTVDLRDVLLQADTALTAPRFAGSGGARYLTARSAVEIDLSATENGDGATYSASGLPRGAELDAATGLLTWEPAPRDSGRHDLRIVADDGQSVATRSVELVVSPNRQETVRAAVADGTDPEAVHTTETREPYEVALTAAREAARQGSEAEFRAALDELLSRIGALRLLNPTLADGTLDYRDGVVTATTLDTVGLNNLADDHNGTGIADLRVDSFVLDFGTRYRIAPSAFGFQARFTFGNRLQGTSVYGSNDGITWDLLTERETVNTNLWENVDVVAEHAGEEYRYLRLRVDHPGIETDPAYPGLWSFAGFRVHGERSEVEGSVTDVSVSSPDALSGRVTAGDRVTVSLSSPTPIDDVVVEVGGQPVEATSEDGRSWNGTAELGELSGGGRLDVTVDHTTEGGRRAATIHGTTDATALYGSDERSLVDLADARVVDASGAADPTKAAQAARMLDGNATTFSEVGAVGGERYLVWDFGEGSTVAVERVDLLARLDNTGMVNLDNLVFQGSNDLREWTDLTASPAKVLAWQNLASRDGGAYRYLRVRADRGISIAELRVHGDVRLALAPVLARADALDLSDYTRASRILFPREVEAVRAAAAEEGADETALALRLLDAWDLLEVATSSAPADVDPSWVTASTGTADGASDAAANGWRMFDGDPATYTDTTTRACTVTVLPTDGSVFEVETVRYHPRSGAVSRATGMPVEGSNDGGATWTALANTGVPVAGWNTVPLASPVRYGALRISGGNGYCNVAELRFVVRTVDGSALDLYLTESADLAEADWTAASWETLVTARLAARAVADDRGADQGQVDEAADALSEAITALVRA